MYSFNGDKSTTNLIRPLDFGTKNALEHHSDGSLAGTSSMILSLSADFRVLLASGCW